VRVTYLTTSYPRFPGDAAGHFVLDAVEQLGRRGIEAAVVSPATFRHFGVAYGAGIMGNLRRNPLLGLAVPAMLASFAAAARRASRDAELVHAHWLPSGAVAMTTGKPFVVQLWGTDAEIAQRVPWLARRILRSAAAVVTASSALAETARELGARDVVVIPHGVELPASTEPEAAPPHVLYVGRLSAEKGVQELARAATGLELVVAGDGPLREVFPGALGFVPHEQLGRLYGRAAVVACPSRREGFGMACLEAMAHGRPVVASAVGGLRDLVADGETGLLVPPGDPAALRRAIQQLLGDAGLRRRMGAAARERARERFSWEAHAEGMREVYAEAVR
jgi:glycosyltransferase involved in cell wall biosynthesis